MFAELVAQIEARESVPLNSLKRGAYCKIGSNCLIVVSKRKNAIQCDKVDATGTRSHFALDLRADLPVKPMTESEALTLVKLRESEGIKPFSIFDGLWPTLAIYLRAEKLAEQE